MYGVVPPEAEFALNEMVWPASSEVESDGDEVRVGSVSAEFIVSVLRYAEATTEFTEALSVIMTFASIVFPSADEGIVQMKLFEVDEVVYACEVITVFVILFEIMKLYVY